MRSDAKDGEEYLAELPDDRRAALSAVRQVILQHLPSGYEEVMNWGMITYQVPRETYPDTYNGQPLMYAALASQKRHMAVYLMAMYLDEEVERRFEASFRQRGKTYDAGKSCVRFKHLDDLPLELVGEIVALHAPEEFVELSERARAKTSRAGAV